MSACRETDVSWQVDDADENYVFCVNLQAVIKMAQNEIVKTAEKRFRNMTK